MKLSEKEWEPFFISSLFKDPKRGKRIVSSNHIEGDTPLVSSAGDNNGVTAFIRNREKVRIYENCLSIANGGSSAGKCFYEPFEFIASDHITHCKNEKLTANQYLAIASVITPKLTEKYSFCREITDLRISREKIMLPVDDAGKPDFEYLEKYVCDLRKKLVEEYISYAKKELQKISFLEVPALNEKEWEPFTIEDICYIDSGCDIYDNERVDGNTPYITATAVNNGIKYYVSNENDTLESNAISVNRNGSVGYSFYHKYNALYSNDCRKLKLKQNDNEYVSLFITNQIMQQREKYSYGYKMGTGRLRRQYIQLPIKSIGNPDYEYMERYIKNIIAQKYKAYLEYAEK